MGISAPLLSRRLLLPMYRMASQLTRKLRWGLRKGQGASCLQVHQLAAQDGLPLGGDDTAVLPLGLRVQQVVHVKGVDVPDRGSRIWSMCRSDCLRRVSRASARVSCCLSYWLLRTKRKGWTSKV